MADQLWQGNATAVAQVSTGSIDSVDGTPANNTFTVTLGGVAGTVTGDTDVNTTATALRAALNASTHPYFSSITWSGSSGSITGTADNAGEPFTAALTVAGAGTGSVTDFSATTSNAGNNVLAAANMDGAALPGNGDRLTLRNNATDILYALDAMTSTTTLEVVIEKSFTGKVGLDGQNFRAAGAAVTTADEYREDELTIDGATLLFMPRHAGAGTPTGSPRVCVNFKASAATVNIEDTSTTATETNLEPVRLRGTNASNAHYQSGGIVGWGTNDPSDTATLGTLELTGGRCNLSAGVTVTTATVRGGTLNWVVGAAATTLNIWGGTVNISQIAAANITTINLYGGVLNMNLNGATVAAINHYGGTLNAGANGDAFTVTAYTVKSPRQSDRKATIHDNVTVTTFAFEGSLSASY